MNEQRQPTLQGVNGAEPRGYEGFAGVIAPRSSQSQPWWPSPVRAPEGAPNVVVILIDDMGFSDVEPFGSEIDTPAIQALADEGYRFTNFRVMPVCSPTRAALLTGVNPHRAGFGMVANINPGYPGLRMELPDDMPTLAETFGSQGYSTFMVGKWHLTVESKMHDGADKSSWPVQRGFDRYFGSMEGFTTMFHPHRLVRDNSPVTEEFADDDYLTDRLTDEAIDMIASLRAGDSSRPFFLYFAHNAVHGPVQAKADDIERQRGAYDAGWNRIRAERFERQKSLGLFDANVELSPSGPEDTGGVQPWDDLDDSRRALFARHMEVYAAAVTAVDDSVARLVAHLKDIGEYENTIFVFTSDNGGTGEGGLEGTRSYFSQFTQQPSMPEGWIADVPRPLADMGGPRVFGHYPMGWAHVSNTPFRMYKGSTQEGGVHSPLIVSWPAGLARKNADDGIRAGFTYVTDIAPTLVELCGITRPETLRGVPTEAIDGESFVPALRDDRLPERSPAQYITMLGGRAFYEGKWKVVASRPSMGPDDLSPWSLFDIVADPTEVRDVSSQHPDIVADLAEKWRRAAWHNTVFPLPDEPKMLATVPSTELEFERPVRLLPGTPTLERHRSAKLVALRSIEIIARFEGDAGEGIIVSHGDQGGGYIAWMENDHLHVSYNAYGHMHRSHLPMATGVTLVTLRFDALNDFAWRISVELDGRTHTLFERVPMLVGMAPFTGISVGFDGGGPVDWELHERHGMFRYRGGLRGVEYVPGARAPYNREVVVAIDDLSARLLD
ncbi:arylsulfatase [Microbacterium lacus]|uniref:arylsulfatase n=1 Tax=Microbacterium lacus TaxID=415217 RepID=UPI00384EE153